jgi:hypothetical protein
MGGKADMARAHRKSVANDPKRHFVIVNYRIAKGSFNHLVGAVIEAAAISETASATASSTETTSADQ